jgi:hypothetical protein
MLRAQAHVLWCQLLLLLSRGPKVMSEFAVAAILASARCRAAGHAVEAHQQHDGKQEWVLHSTEMNY